MGWVAAFVYCACAALRLARFNTNLGVIDKRFFQGLPSPAAAGLIAGFVWTMEAFDLEPQRIYEMRWLAWGAGRVRRTHHGEQRALLQRQRHQPAQGVPFGVVVMIVLMVVVAVAGGEQHPRVAVQHLPALRRLGLRAVGGGPHPQAAGAQAAAGGHAAGRAYSRCEASRGAGTEARAQLLRLSRLDALREYRVPDGRLPTPRQNPL